MIIVNTAIPTKHILERDERPCVTSQARTLLRITPIQRRHSLDAPRHVQPATWHAIHFVYFFKFSAPKVQFPACLEHLLDTPCGCLEERLQHIKDTKASFRNF